MAEFSQHAHPYLLGRAQPVIPLRLISNVNELNSLGPPSKSLPEDPSPQFIMFNINNNRIEIRRNDRMIWALYHVAIPTDVSLFSLSERQSRRQSRAAGLQRMTRWAWPSKLILARICKFIARFMTDCKNAMHLLYYFIIIT